ncbi:MAG TPA: heavy metal-binding domain-containing protein [Pyrinomonadaceae bacterium]|nr:heavy metal-binding domain-containing protein [Pyrinomonadaceae bacterium]
MKLRKFLLVPPLAAVFLFPFGVHSPVLAVQKERSAHSKKPTQFHYVCPMHDDVTSKSRGVCRKCKMKLVRKPIIKEPTTGTN